MAIVADEGHVYEVPDGARVEVSTFTRDWDQFARETARLTGVFDQVEPGARDGSVWVTAETPALRVHVFAPREPFEDARLDRVRALLAPRELRRPVGLVEPHERNDGDGQ